MENVHSSRTFLRPENSGRLLGREPWQGTLAIEERDSTLREIKWPGPKSHRMTEWRLKLRSDEVGSLFLSSTVKCLIRCSLFFSFFFFNISTKKSSALFFKTFYNHFEHLCTPDPSSFFFSVISWIHQTFVLFSGFPFALYSLCLLDSLSNINTQKKCFDFVPSANGLDWTTPTIHMLKS